MTKSVLINTVLWLSLAAAGWAQAPPVPVQSVIYSNIRSTSTLDGYGYIDNRSQFTRQSNYHAFRAYGTGTWQVEMFWADTNTSWTSYGSTAVVSNSSPSSAIGYGIDPSTASHPYHDYIKWVFTGNVTIQNYFGTKNAWWSPSVAGISYPLAINQGGTGLSVQIYEVDIQEATPVLACTAAGTGTLLITKVHTAQTTYNYTTTGCPMIFMGGAKFRPASGQTLTFTVQNAPLQTICDLSSGGSCIIKSATGDIYPQWWGDDPSDSTDDSAALNAAFASSAGGVVRLTPGTHIGCVITPVSNSEITGPPQAIVKLKTGCSSGVTDLFYNSLASPVSNVKIHGFTIDGNKTNVAVESSTISMAGNNISIYDLAIHDTSGRASQLSGATSSSVGLNQYNLVITAPSKAGSFSPVVAITQGSGLFDNIYIENSAGYAAGCVDLEPNAGQIVGEVTISNMNLSNCSINASNGAGGGARIRKVTMTNNVVIGTGVAGNGNAVNLVGVENFTGTGNQVYCRSSACVNMQSMSNGTWTGGTLNMCWGETQPTCQVDVGTYVNAHAIMLVNSSWMNISSVEIFQDVASSGAVTPPAGIFESGTSNNNRFTMPTFRLVTTPITLAGANSKVLRIDENGLFSVSGLNFANAGIIYPTTDGTNAVSVTKADGTTSMARWDTLNSRFCLLCTGAPTATFEMNTDQGISGIFNMRTASDTRWEFKYLGTRQGVIGWNTGVFDIQGDTLLRFTGAMRFSGGAAGGNRHVCVDNAGNVFYGGAC